MSAGARSSSTKFCWVWWEDATEMLYYYGFDEFYCQEGRFPYFSDFLDVLLYGYYLTGWDEVDPWFFACKGFGICEDLWLKHHPAVRRRLV
ncbi:MAG: hypothetical protein ABSD57_12225 [Verrucomicrobiota bacterium]|jgi:hypothetical protein